MALDRSKTQTTVLAVLGLYLLWSVLSSFSTPSFHYYPSEFQNNDLEVEAQNDIHQNRKTFGYAYAPEKKVKLPPGSTLRKQLLFQFPYYDKKPFPNIIWQTWKVGINDPKFPKEYKEYVDSWKKLNPNHRHHVLSDEMCESLITETYGPVPDVLEAYNSLPKSILKADFFRYLILYARGGVYSDVDTKALKPIENWKPLLPELYGKKITIGIAVGVEADVGTRDDWEKWYARQIQFCQWTIQLKPGHPLLRELIANITEQTLTRKKNGQLTSILGKDEGGDIMNWTGPAVFTDSIFGYINNIMQPADAFLTRQYTTKLAPKFFIGMKDAYVIDDIMILPITSFSPDIGQMGSKSSNDELAYSKHMFSGSWKPEDERMKGH